MVLLVQYVERGYNKVDSHIKLFLHHLRCLLCIQQIDYIKIIIIKN